MEFKWEEITNNGSRKEENWWEATYRAKVFGGWVIKNELCHDSGIENYYGYSHRDNKLFFIPDPNHEWKLENV